MDIQDIVQEWLEKNGYDGLCNPDIECGCRTCDLMPCDMLDHRKCVAGYVEMQDDGKWLVFPGKAKRTPAEWEKLTGIKIIDPDGWRQDGKDCNELIDKQEWEKRMMQSACLIPLSVFDKAKRKQDEG